MRERDDMDRLLRQANSLTCSTADSPELSEQISMAESRAELDQLLQQADNLVGASPMPPRLAVFNPPEAHKTELDTLLRQADSLASMRLPNESPSLPTIRGASSAVRTTAAHALSVPPSSSAIDPTMRRHIAAAPASSRDGAPSPARLARSDMSVLRAEGLEAMATEVSEYAGRGRPTAICVHARWVAVGTSHGHVGLFDRRDVWRSWLLASSARPAASVSSSLASSLLGSLALASSHAVASCAASSSHVAGDDPTGKSSAVADPVTAVQLAKGGGLLLAGHASGRLVLWGVDECALLKDGGVELHDAPITHLRFLHVHRPHALTVDAGGTAHLCTFSRLVMSYTVTRQCLFDGAAGVVTAAEILAGYGQSDARGGMAD